MDDHVCEYDCEECDDKNGEIQELENDIDLIKDKIKESVELIKSGKVDDAKKKLESIK